MGLRSILIQKIMANGSFFLTGNYNFMAAQSFSKEILINMTYLNLSKQTDTFTTEISQLWPEVSYEANVNSTDHFLSLPLRHNSLIRINNRPVYYKSWSCKGIQNVTDLLKDPNIFLSSHELKERYLL